MDYKKLLVFSPTQQIFETALANEIADQFVVAFIEEPRMIWAQGIYYPCPFTKEEINNIIKELQDKDTSIEDTIAALVARINKITGITGDSWEAKAGSNYTKNSEDITDAIYDLDRTLAQNIAARKAVTGLQNTYTPHTDTIISDANSLHNADKILADSVKKEVSDRTAAVQLEANSRQTEDNRIESKVDAEVQRSTDKDTKIEQSITNLTNSINADLTKVKNMLKEGATLDEAKTALTALGSDYKDLYSLASHFKTFLTSADAADTTINSWKEIETFLDGITDTETLTGLLKNISDNVNSRITSVTGVNGLTFQPVSTSSYINSADSLADAVQDLDTALKTTEESMYSLDQQTNNRIDTTNKQVTDNSQAITALQNNTLGNIKLFDLNEDNKDDIISYINAGNTDCCVKYTNGKFYSFWSKNHDDEYPEEDQYWFISLGTGDSPLSGEGPEALFRILMIGQQPIYENSFKINGRHINNNTIDERNLTFSVIEKLNQVNIIDYGETNDNLLEAFENNPKNTFVRLTFTGKNTVVKVAKWYDESKRAVVTAPYIYKNNLICSIIPLEYDDEPEVDKYTIPVELGEKTIKNIKESQLSDDVAAKLNQIRIFEVTSTSDNTEVINAYKANPDNVFVKLNTGSQVFVLKVTHWQSNDVNSNLVTERANVGGTERFILINTTGYSLGDVSFNLANIPTITKNKLSADLQNTINQLDGYTSIENIDNIINTGTYKVNQTVNGATIPNLLQVIRFNNSNQSKQVFYDLLNGVIKYRTGITKDNTTTWNGWIVAKLDGVSIKDTSIPTTALVDRSVTKPKLSQDLQDAVNQLTITIDISQIDDVKTVGTYIVTKKVNNPVPNDLTVACLLQVCEPIKNFIRQVFYDLPAGVIKYRGINDNNIWTDWVNFKWNANSLNIDVETNADPKSTAATTDNSVTTRLTSTNGRLYPKVKLHSYDASRDISETATNLVEEKALAKHLKELDTKFSTPSQVDARFQSLVGAAPEALDTLEEIAAKIQDGDDIHTALVNDIAGKIGKDDLTIDCALSVQEDGHTKVRVIGKVDGVEKTAGAFHIKSLNGNQLVGTGDLKLDIPDLKVFQVTVDSDNTELITYCNSADYHNNVIILYNSNVFVPYTVNAVGINTNYALNASYGCISLNITANAATRITGSVNGAVLSKDTVTLNHLAPNLKHPYQIIGMDKLDTATDNGFYLVQNGINEDGAGSQYPLWLQVMNMLGRDTNINYCKQCLYDGYVGIFKVRMKPDTSTNWGEWKYLNLDGTYIKDGSITKDKLADDVKSKLNINHYLLVLGNNNTFVHLKNDDNVSITTGLKNIVKDIASTAIYNKLEIKHGGNIIRLETIIGGDNPIVIASMVDYDTLSKTYFKITIGDTPAECTVESKTVNILNDTL